MTAPQPIPNGTEVEAFTGQQRERGTVVASTLVGTRTPGYVYEVLIAGRGHFYLAAGFVTVADAD